MERKTHIVVVSVPVLSHQLAIAELFKRLIQVHANLHVTFILPVIDSIPNASKTILDALSSLNIDTIVLPSVHLPQGIVPALLFPLAMSQSLPYVHDALNSLTTTTSSPIVALVADYFAYEVLPFAKKLNILSYIFLPTAASVLPLCFHSSMLHETITCEYRDLKEPIKIPGCVPIHGKDLPNSFQDRSSEVYKHFLLRSKGILLADGVLVNSFVELEADAVRAMMDQSGSNPSVHMVGPIVQSLLNNNTNNNGSECLAWLNEQKHGSVLFVSFGSGGTISQDQMNELALGLELSCQKFLWVVREPNDIPSANYFKGSYGQDPLSFLPSGFLERTKEQGLVVPYWAPQVQVLSHNAVGGFLTHCGWFSTIESVVHGLPMIAWPLFSEQRTIATILADGLKVAIRPKVNENGGIVEKGEVANVVKRLMVGHEGMGIRERMKVLKDAAAGAMRGDGSSMITMSELVSKWNGRLSDLAREI